MERKNTIPSYFQDLVRLVENLDYESIQKLIEMIWDAYKRDATIFFMGNGGSASIASHMAADIGKNAMTDWKDNNEDRFRTVSLTNCVEWLTALGNDCGYDQVFIQQLRNQARKGDMVVLISSSGNSPNVVNVAEWAKSKGLGVAVMVGFKGGKLKEMADVTVWVPAENYGLVEGLHSDIQHYIVEELKRLKREDSTQKGNGESKK